MDGRPRADNSSMTDLRGARVVGTWAAVWVGTLAMLATGCGAGAGSSSASAPTTVGPRS